MGSDANRCLTTVTSLSVNERILKGDASLDTVTHTATFCERIAGFLKYQQIDYAVDMWNMDQVGLRPPLRRYIHAWAVAILVCIVMVLPTGLILPFEARNNLSVFQSSLPVLRHTSEVTPVSPFASLPRSTPSEGLALSDASRSPALGIPVGSAPEDVAYDSGRGELFVANTDSANVSVISDVTNTVADSIYVSNPDALAYDSGKGEIFVAAIGHSDVSVISDTSNTVVTTVNTSSESMGIAYDSARGEVFVTHYFSNAVSIINDSTNSVVETINVGYAPIGLAYDSSKREVYIANSASGNVSVISDSTNTVVASIGVGSEPYGVTYDFGRGEIFVANGGSDNVSVISDVNNTVIHTIALAGEPSKMAYDENRGEVFLSNGSGTTSVINDSTNVVATNVRVGSDPLGLVYDSGKVEVFVANSGSNNVTVINASLPFSAAAEANPTSGPAWLDVSFVATAAWGDGLYSYLWTFGGGNTSRLQDPTLVFEIPGSYQASVVIMDTAGNKATSNTVWVNVSHPLPFTATMSGSKSSVAVGEPTWLNTSMVGGVSPFTFIYSLPSSTAGCVNSAGPSIKCTPTRANRTFNVSVLVTDAYGATVNATSSNVIITPVSLMVSSSLTSVNVGQPVVFNTTTSGDATTLTYSYAYPTPAGCVASTGPSITCTPQEPNWSFAVTVEVTDTYGNVWNATSPTVTTAPVSATLSAPLTSVDVGQSVVFATVTSGEVTTPSYAYSYPTFAGCAASTNSSETCTPTAAGNFTVTVHVADAYKNTWNVTSATVRVFPALTASVTVSNATLWLGDTVFISGLAGGGLAPYTYNFTGLPPGCVAQGTDQIGCFPTESGNYTIHFIVRDANAWSNSATQTLSITFDFIIIAPSNAAAGQMVVIRVDSAPGVGKLSYTYSNLPPGCISQDTPTLNCTPTEPGKYQIGVTVKDQGGHDAFHTFELDVSPGSTKTPTTNGFLGLSGDLGYVVVGVVAAGVVIALALVRRRFKASTVGSNSESDAYAEYRGALTDAEREQIATVNGEESDPAEDIF
jgi:YVTN family beta-propeller protein